MRPFRLLDLFCGAGGCAVGYARAGFEVVGVDNRPQPRYPFAFVQADALEYLREHGREFDAVHASPPCQGYSRLAKVPWIKVRADLHPLLIEDVRGLLDGLGRPWVIENVEDAPLGGIILCGLMFGLGVFRHRRFESSTFLMQPSHGMHKAIISPGGLVNDKGNPARRRHCMGIPQVIGVYGHQFRKADASRAMGIDWMNREELRQAIPPAYTEFVGRQLIDHLRYKDGAA